MSDNISAFAVDPSPASIRTTEDASNQHSQHVIPAYLDGSGEPVPVTELLRLPVEAGYADSAAIDAFSRLRVSNPEAVFDTKQLFDNQPMFWDQDLTGSATSNHDTDTATTTLAVTTSGDVAIRQTKRRFNYQPGRSQFVLMTTLIGAQATGVVKRVGLFDDDNGIFLQQTGSAVSFVVRSSTSGSPVDTNAAAQASWNIDPMDGTGPSGLTLDLEKVQIIAIDYEWLGVGRVRVGFVIGGRPRYVHEFNQANVGTTVYMSTPNLPLRYEISSSSDAESLDHICCVVLSEGGARDNGLSHYVSTNGTPVAANTSGVMYAALGWRLKSGHESQDVHAVAASMLVETADPFEWILCMNPTLSGSGTFVAETNFSVEVARPAGAITASAVGFARTGGFVASGGSLSVDLHTFLSVGTKIDGTRDEVWLLVRPLSANASVHASATLRQLS